MAEVDRDHQVGAAGDGHGLGMLRLQRERLVERAGKQHLHQAVTVAKASIIAGTSSPSG